LKLTQLLWKRSISECQTAGTQQSPFKTKV
jgi:hypothetical protein